MSILIAAPDGRLKLRMIREATEGTLRNLATIFLVPIAVTVFSMAFRGLN